LALRVHKKVFLADDRLLFFTSVSWVLTKNLKVAGDKGISETKSKQQSNCMHQPVTSWGNACSTCMDKPVRCMHWPVMSQADACTYCMGSKVSSLSLIYLYSSYFEKICSRYSQHFDFFVTYESVL
jgi:hypothetical protein